MIQQRMLWDHLCFQHSEEYVDIYQDQLEPQPIETSTEEGIFFCNMPKWNSSAHCPIPSCGVEILQRYGMRCHFSSQHKSAGAYFPGEESQLVPCPYCGLKVSTLEKHIGGKLCEKAAARAQKV